MATSFFCGHLATSGVGPSCILRPWLVGWTAALSAEWYANRTHAAPGWFAYRTYDAARWFAYRTYDAARWFAYRTYDTAGWFAYRTDDATGWFAYRTFYAAERGDWCCVTVFCTRRWPLLWGARGTWTTTRTRCTVSSITRSGTTCSLVAKCAPSLGMECRLAWDDVRPRHLCDRHGAAGCPATTCSRRWRLYSWRFFDDVWSFG